MSFLKKIFTRKDAPVNSYTGFWTWFAQHESSFHKVVKGKGNIERDFFDVLSPKLNELREGFYLLTGNYDDQTVELVFTADGIIKNMVFAEELVQAAPALRGWKFTALKPATDVQHIEIEMAGYSFNRKNIHFFANEDPGMPDEIDVTIVHDDYSEENKKTITNGCFIFLDNMLGELNLVSQIDRVEIAGPGSAQKELIPIGKMADYLVWRQKEFIEKYEGVRHSTEEDNYSMLEAELKGGGALLAVINSDLLNWDSKASHPWILTAEVKYDGSSNNGMPDEKTYGLLNELEDRILAELRDADGYLNIGRQTAQNAREIYLACKEFRKPSKIMAELEKEYAGSLNLSYDIYKDKYWRSFARFADPAE